MKLYEKLYRDIIRTEFEANDGPIEPIPLKRVKYIKIHPRVLHDLFSEETAALKAGEIISPYMEYDLIHGHKFMGIPLQIDPKTIKWEIII